MLECKFLTCEYPTLIKLADESQDPSLSENGEFKQEEIITAGEVFINKGISGGSTVD